MSPSAWMAQCLRETDSSLRHSALAGSRPMLVSASFRCVIVPFLAPTTTAILGSMVSSHLRQSQHDESRTQKSFRGPLIANRLCEYTCRPSPETEFLNCY